MNNIQNQLKGNKGKLSAFINAVIVRISGFFEPEEVEVTFTSEGNQVKYTYTKVEHKRVA